MYAREVEVCQMIMADMDRDMSQMEGQPFNGRNVAAQFGHQAAAIKALAKTVEKLLIAMQDLEARKGGG